MQIRTATPDDEAACGALLSELGAVTGTKPDPGLGETFQSLLTKDRGQIIVAAENGVVLGMATVSFNVALRYRGEYCQLEELIVSAAARGRNLGGQLVQAAIDAAKERGCVEMGLYLLPTTEHNRPFYAKYGFEPLGTEMRQRLDR